MNKLISLTLSFLFLSSHCIASETPEWLYKAIKTNNPNQLAYFIEISKSCPIDIEHAHDITQGVFIRSRIKPIKDEIFVPNRVYLSLVIHCVKLQSGNPVFSISTDFARYNPKPAILFDYPFGFNGIGPKDYIQQEFKNSVERAVTAFVKSNFNL